MPATTLVPGYKQVESFGPDEDYLEEEEEISYVTLDLGVVEPTLLPSTSTYRLIVSVAPLVHGADDKEDNERAWIHQRLSCSSPARYSKVVMTRFSAPSSYSRRKKVGIVGVSSFSRLPMLKREFRRHAAKQAFFGSCWLHRTAHPLQGSTTERKGTTGTDAF